MYSNKRNLRQSNMPSQTWAEFSRQYDRVNSVATGRITSEQAKQMFNITLVGELIPNDDGYQASQHAHGRRHAYTTDPYKDGYTQGKPNQGFEHTNGRHPFASVPDMPYPKSELRDDLKANEAHRNRPRYRPRYRPY